MANHKQRRPPPAAASTTPAKPSAKAFIDSFQNLEARLGYGAGNQLAAGSYGFDFISRNRTLLEAAYQSNWMAGVAVDIVAEDMTREGIEIQSSLKPDQVEKIQQAFDDLGVWDQICDNIKWARLYGGSLGVILIDGQDMKTPLRVDTIKKDQFKGLMVLDRWLVQPTMNMIVKDYGPGFGLPMFYDVVADSLALPRQRIHHSRCIRIDGADLPYWRKVSENLWGISVLEKLWDRIMAFDSASMGAAQLVFKAHLRTYKVKGLRDILATGGKAQDGLLKQIEFIRRYQSNEGMTLLDGEDEFDATSYTFSGLADMILQFGQQLAGALQIPLVRLFGQAPAGLNSTGESDLRTYQDNIARQQERKLRGGLAKLLDIVSRSTLGKPLPDGTTFQFRPLYQLSAEQKATVAKTIVDAVVAIDAAGIWDRATSLQELRAASHQTGFGTNVTDEMIEEAKLDPPPVPEGMEGIDPNAPTPTGPNARSRQEAGKPQGPTRKPGQAEAG